MPRVITTLTYNQSNNYRLVKRFSKRSTAPALQDITYTYDTAGNLLSQSGNGDKSN